MSLVNYIQSLHQSTKRDYLERVNAFDKAHCSEIAKQFSKDYWDGERQYGYGGYSYDGRWRSIAKTLVEQYHIDEYSNILDIGCGKGYLMYELSQLVPDANIQGIDISTYAIEHAKPEIQAQIRQGSAVELPYAENSFDLVISNGALHNLKIYELKQALQEISRVCEKYSWICVESYRNEKEKVNLLYWQLTCESFYSVQEWEWLYKNYGYRGDYEFIYFE